MDDGTFDLGQALTMPPELNLTPTARSALLSFGLQAMQPTAIGQTTMGHLAQAVGAAGETVTRQEAMDLKEEEKRQKMQAIQDRLDIARQTQDSRERGLDIRERIGDTVRQQRDRLAEQRDRDLERREREADRRGRDTESRIEARIQAGDQRNREIIRREVEAEDRRRDRESRIGARARSGDQRDRALGIQQQNADRPRGASSLLQQRDEIKQRQEYDRNMDKEANTIYKHANDLVTGERGPYASWRGKTVEQIREALKAQKPFAPTQRYTTPLPDDDDDDDEDPNDTPATPTPAPAIPSVVPPSSVAPTAPRPQAPLTVTGNIPTAAVDRLKANPQTADQFDAIFGAGSAARILGTR